MNTKIFACDQGVEIGCRVITWQEPEGFSFYKHGKFAARPNHTLEQLQQEIKLGCLHHSVTYTAKHCYQGLLARGLSCNFLIDDDNVDGYATIYQCLDMKDAGYSHGPYNKSGPGVEICYQPAAWLSPNLYSEANIKKYGVQPHPKLKDTVHRMTVEVFAPTDAQINSAIALMKGWCLLFPNIKPEFPKDAKGEFLKTVTPTPVNLISHFNLTAQKIDPLGFPFARAETQLQQELAALSEEKTQSVWLATKKFYQNILRKIKF